MHPLIPAAAARIALALAMLTTVTASQADARQSMVGPKAFYLALGDSITWGLQPARPAHSFADDLAVEFAPMGTKVVVNLACSGETSTTFVRGGCPWARNVRYPYHGAQLQAALAFIHEHPGMVSPVTVEIGYNDPLRARLIQPRCTLAPEKTISQALAAFSSNLDSILTDLRTALHGTGDLLVTNNYVGTQNTCSASNTLQRRFNARLAIAVARAGAMLVPIYDVFNTPAGQSPMLCQLTWVCSGYGDIHPNDAGQQAIAKRILAITGYR
jgi:lysophospholipase L1-like esterase